MAANFQAYGAPTKSGSNCSVKAFKVARCSIERLMRCLGLRGAIREKIVPPLAIHSAMPTGSRQSAVQDRSTESATGLGFYVRLDQTRLCLCRFRY